MGIGKWHLGYEKHLLPPHHGFDYFLASLGGTIDYFYHNEPTGEPVLYENLKQVRRDGYFTDLITDTASSSWRSNPPTNRSFCIFPTRPRVHPFSIPTASPTSPRYPTSGTRRTGRKGTANARPSSSGSTRASASARDAGRDRRADETLFIFCSDNGAYPIAASNAPFRGYASELFEGGIHVACMARWPATAGGRVDDRHMLTFDLTASILAAAGSPSPDQPLDGIDVLGQIAAGEPAQPRTLFWRARRANRTWKAVRDGNLKYVSKSDDDGLSEFLFDLGKDPGESDNLLSTQAAEASKPQTNARGLGSRQVEAELGWCSQ